VAEQMPDIETLKSFNTGLVEEFRANGGKVSGKYQEANLLLLTTTGAKTGQPRVTPLAYFRFDGKLIIIGGSWGAQPHPAWVRNLWANPSVRVEVDTESFDATARELRAAERELVWTQIVATAPVIDEYQSRTDRVIPLFELQPHLRETRRHEG
jgi:deazaflavin-dependent oxidoreductase (nitroreductase family)